MQLVRAAGLFACYALWRVARLRGAGRALVHALGSLDENARTIAGMFLVRAGHRAVPLLREELGKRENLPIVLTILGDIGERDLAPEIRAFCDDTDAGVAEAARRALRVLEGG